MPEPIPPPHNGAVFLSYASQDAESARRICDALRASGVEVWFDQSELVGGDSWDQKIRGQIGSCALFVPLISANTQARLEGYFRLEWKLAAQRTHTMADEKTFLLPVVIDATRDAEAKVPVEFKTVQWTRLRPAERDYGGQARPEEGDPVLEKFCERVKQVLGGESSTGILPVTSGHGQDARATSEAVGASLDDARGRRQAAPLQKPSRSWLVPTLIGAAVIVALAISQPWRDATGAASTASSAVAADSAAKPAAASLAPTEAQKLVEQARQVLEKSDDLNRENLYLVEDLAKRALALEPANADAWLIGARVSYSFVWLLIDNSTQRRELALQQAKRAVALAPGSGAARLALLNTQSLSFSTFSNTALASDLEREARALVAAEPRDWRAHRALGTILRGLARSEDCIVEHRTAYELSHDNPSSAADLINVLVRRRLFAEADEVRARAMGHNPAGRLLCWDAMLKLRWHGDPAAAREALKTWPGWLGQEDRGLFQTWQTWMWSRQPEPALQTARIAVRDMVRDFSFYGPVAVLRAQANELAGNTEAAQADWQTALARAERELAAEADSEAGLYWKAWALARLGRVAEAKPLVSLLAQRNQGAVSAFFKATYLEPLQLLVGEKQLALTGLRRRLTVIDDSVGLTRAMLELDPAYDTVRADPEFQAIVRVAPAPRPSVSTRADDKSVAVLAFRQLSADPENEYLCEAISDELCNVLGRVPGLKVAASASAFSFKGKRVRPSEMAAQLGVAYLVDGSVQKVGNRVRVRAQLIKAADESTAWSSELLEQEAKDMFAVQDDVVAAIAKNLELQLGAGAARAPIVINPQALELFVRGREAWKLRTLADYDRAEDLLNRALALEPNFARAHAALADVWFTRAQDRGAIGGFGQRNSPEHLRIVARINRALTLDPDLAEAHATLGGVAWVTWQMAESERALRQAIALNPNYATAHQWLGRLLLSDGRMDEALAELKLATEIDPLAPRILDNYGLGLYLAGRYREAVAVDDRALALQPNSVQTSSGKALVLAASGRLAEAVALVQTIPLESGNPGGRVTRVRVFAQAGMKAEAEALLTGFDSKNRVSPIDCLFALGRSEEAIGMLTPAGLVASGSANYLFDPLYDSVRNDPRLVKIRAEVGATEAHDRAQAWRKAHPPEKPEGKK